MNSPRRTTNRNRFQAIAVDGTVINLGASTFENATKRLATFSRYTPACKAVADGAVIVDSATDERFSFSG